MDGDEGETRPGGEKRTEEGIALMGCIIKVGRCCYMPGEEREVICVRRANVGM